jgi:hypothetical protein
MTVCGGLVNVGAGIRPNALRQRKDVLGLAGPTGSISLEVLTTIDLFTGEPDIF